MGQGKAEVEVVAVIPRQRQYSAAPLVDRQTWKQVWLALHRAKEHYDPRILDAAEGAVLECYRPAVATHAAPSYGLDQVQAEALADLALAKAVRQCRAWDIHGFELYVQAAVESELRTNTRPAPMPPLARPSFGRSSMPGFGRSSMRSPSSAPLKHA